MIKLARQRQQTLLELMGERLPVERPQVEPFQQLARLAELCRQCANCALRGGCRQVVFGDGHPGSGLMLVGEGPGADEDRLGKPFVGAAGQLLTRILQAVNFSREEVYITNVVKCRPPGNRVPAPAEIAACLPHLQEQIRLINPAIIVCLGAVATRALVGQAASVTRLRGRWHEQAGRLIMPTFHPAALLRDPSKKRPVWEDFQQVELYYRRNRDSCNLDGGNTVNA